MMNFVIYFSIAVVIIGFVVLGIALWALITHREEKYKMLLDEHITQKNRVQKKLDKKDGNE